MMHEAKPIPIVIPLHHGGGKLGGDFELRYALRGLEQHFKNPMRIIIVGKSLPGWITGVEHLPAKKGLKSALRVAAQAFPAGFIWWYDDLVLLRDITAAEAKVTPAVSRWQKPKTPWAHALNRVKKRLAEEGYEPHDYSRPHGPYWFDQGMVVEAFLDWPDMAGKFPFESWILSKRNWPRRQNGWRQYYGAFAKPPGEGTIYMNYNDRGNTQELRDWLRERFPQQSRYETTQEMSKKDVYDKQGEHLYGVWEEMGRPALRTICECAVGPWSLLERFREHCGRAIFIEPDPVMSRKARANYPWAEHFEVAIATGYGKANLRKLNGSSYVKGIPWAPAFDVCPRRAQKAGKVAVGTAPFGSLDDGEIDLMNLDCEGSEWFVLSGMRSRPRFLQIELYPNHGHHAEISQWIEAEGYRVAKRWGNANLILVRG